MKISYNWLKEYLGKAPEPEKIAELFDLYSYEVKSIEKIKNGDSVLDIDILPNRAHDSLCHRGIARELATVISQKIKLPARESKAREQKTNFEVRNLAEDKCPRYIAKVIKNIEVKESPDWLQERVIAIGQRPINNIVDALNYTMFDMGQPMHAFDMDKLSGAITIRNAEAGEKFTTLDNKSVELNGEDMVIADDKIALAIAGIKGGKNAEVSSNTKNIVLESANFKEKTVRKTSRRLNILTDASKRFENGLAPELAEIGMREATALIVDIAGTKETIVEESVDVYQNRPSHPFFVGVSTDEINKVLGTDIKKKEVEDILKKLGFAYKKVKPIEEIEKQVQLLVGAKYVPIARIRFDAPNVFSCSSLTNYIFVQAGFALPSVSVDQYVFSERISEKEARFGDLVFSNTGNGKIHYETKEWMSGTKVPEGIDHLGLYLGDGKVLHASRYTKKGVEIENITDSVAFKTLCGYGRIIKNPDEERFVVEIPPERLDLRIKEDLIEEIGRVYGFNDIKPKLPDIFSKKPKANQTFAYLEDVKDALVKIGFNEVNTYSFSSIGEVELENPTSKEMPYMRASILPNFKRALEVNLKNTPLLGSSSVNIFEIGKVFGAKDGERFALALGSNDKKEIETAGELLKQFGINDLDNKESDGLYLAETILAEPLKDLEGLSYSWQSLQVSGLYEPISEYPFILRDIAVWLPEKTPHDELQVIIENESGDLLKRADLFDEYKKDSQVSHAYHLVFQSKDKTLTDDEINSIMDKIYNQIEKKGWQKR